MMRSLSPSGDDAVPEIRLLRRRGFCPQYLPCRGAERRHDAADPKGVQLTIEKQRGGFGTRSVSFRRVTR